MKQKNMRYRRLFSTLCVAILILSRLTGCVDNKFDERETVVPGDGDVSLELVINTYGTRASGSDFSDAEKKVTSVDLFFFKTGSDDTEKALHYLRGVPTMNKEVERSNTGKLTVNVPESIFSDNGIAGCKVFAAVNTDATKDKSGITLGELKALKVQTEWFINNSLMSENGNLSDFNGFVMFTVNPAGDDVTYVEADKKISGTIVVDKLTSKINLSLAFGSDNVSANLRDWTINAPDPNVPGLESKRWKVFVPKAEEKDGSDRSFFGDAVEAYIVNGVKTIPLSGAFNLDGTLKGLTEEDYFDLWAEDTENPDNDFMNYAHGFVAVDNENYPYRVESPFYTYPNAWSDGVLDNATHLVLKVNWYDSDLSEVPSIDSEDLLETYYKIPLNRAEGVSKDKILSNYHYNVKVKINTLGGLHFGEPLQLDDCSYDILPWGKLDFDAKLRFTRYLEVRQQVTDRDGTVYTAIMNNLETASIPFYSSHKVKLQSASISFFDNSSANVVDKDNDVAEPKKVTVNITDLDAFLLSYDDLVGDNNYAGAYIDEISNRLTIKHLFHPVDPSAATVKDEKGNEKKRYVHVLEEKDIRIGNENITFKPNMYSYYDMTLVLEHEDEDSNIPVGERTITIRQYPQMYLDITFNPGGDRIWDNRVGITGNRKYGYTYVNGKRGNGIFESQQYGGVRGIAAGWLNGGLAALLQIANNPMMYLINATNLGPEDAPLHIGDPRVKYTNNQLTSTRTQYESGSLGNLGGTYKYEDLELRTSDDAEANWSGTQCASAPVWKDGQRSTESDRRLLYYYPTDETPIDEVMNTIAPRFRVASAYGSSFEAVNRQEARRRCASYQENGYPAGRWRLPTYGELVYIARLSYMGIIPELFESTQDYWCASGLYRVTANQVRESNTSGWIRTDIDGYTRCVYDEWYWTYKDANGFEQSDKLTNNYIDVFHWGDKPKNNPQKQN